MQSCMIEAGGYLTKVCNIAKIEACLGMPCSGASNNLTEDGGLHSHKYTHAQVE